MTPKGLTAPPGAAPGEGVVERGASCVFVLRQSAAWVLLVNWSFARAVGVANGAAAPLALLALLAYVGFLVALLRAPR